MDVWKILERQLNNVHNAFPTMATLIHDEVAPEDLSQLHLKSFPKEIDPRIRQAAAMHIAHALSPEINNTQTPKETERHESD